MVVVHHQTQTTITARKKKRKTKLTAPKHESGFYSKALTFWNLAPVYTLSIHFILQPQKIYKFLMPYAFVYK